MYLRSRNYSKFDDTWEKQDMDIPYLRPKGYSQAMESHPTPPDRSRDPAEDFYRRLTAGLASNSTYHRSMEFFEFYKDCGKLFRRFIVWSGAYIIISCISGWLIITVILVVQMKRMKQFWEDIFGVPVNYLLFFNEFRSIKLTNLYRKQI